LRPAPANTRHARAIRSNCFASPNRHVTAAARGRLRAAEICLTGRRVPAEEALRIGLVNSVVALDALPAVVDELVATLLRPAAGATRETLALLAAAAEGPTLDKQRAAERTAQFRRLSELRTALGSRS
jgi:enoyl-CoA hydratase/carnithine racemase